MIQTRKTSKSHRIMKTRIIMAMVAGSICLLRPGIAAETEPSKAESKAQARADLQVLVGKVQAKIQQGKKTEQDMGEELKEFDALLLKYKDQKSDDVAQILWMKAMLYIQMFDETEKGLALVNQLKKDFPETTLGKRVDDLVASLKQQGEAKKVQAGLAVGAKFPDFDEKDLGGKPLSVGNYKGKVVLVDFWATWCGPCVGELPNVLKTYEKYHSKGFEIVGISLDSDKSKLTGFIEQRKMSWQQYFDGKGWQNKLAGKYGVNSIPATYLLDTEGKILAKNLRGEQLETEVGKALEKLTLNDKVSR